MMLQFVFDIDGTICFDRFRIDDRIKTVLKSAETYWVSGCFCFHPLLLCKSVYQQIFTEKPDKNAYFINLKDDSVSHI